MDDVQPTGDRPHHDGDETWSRRRMLTIGLPAVALVAVTGSVPFLVGGDGELRSDPASTTTTTTTRSPTTTTRPDDSVFTAARVSTDTVPDASATTTTTTTTPSTTTTTTLPPTTTAAPIDVPDTLPEQPPAPIAPPADPRGAEDQIRLGGISIPKLGVDAPLLEGIRLTTLDNGPGHWPGTAMPGQVGNVVVAGHRTSHGAPFRDIDRLVAGDEVVFDVDGAGTVEYSVTGTQIVQPDAVWIVDPTDTPTATLFACHPPGSTRQRIVVNLELAG